MISRRYRIALAKTAERMLAEILDRHILAQIRSRIDGLALSPEMQGKPLTGDLAGRRSLRAAGRRFRIVYRVDRARSLVIVEGVGLRKEGDKRDIYAIAARMLRLGLL